VPDFHDAAIEYGDDIPPAIRADRDANLRAFVGAIDAVVLHILRSHEISFGTRTAVSVPGAATYAASRSIMARSPAIR
jgi:hypothetical protein